MTHASTVLQKIVSLSFLLLLSAVAGVQTAAAQTGTTTDPGTGLPDTGVNAPATLFTLALFALVVAVGAALLKKKQA